MGNFEKLHIANNLEALDMLVFRDLKVKNLNPDQMSTALKKLYKNIEKDVLDQEKSYILLSRYIAFYEYLLRAHPDKKFVEAMYGSEYKKVLMVFERTKNSLLERYSAIEQSTVVKPVNEEKETAVQVVSKELFNTEFITCQQLFGALQKNCNILLVDARPANDFAESHINHKNCINVPDHHISSGLSANALGKKLPESICKIWELRETFDVIVLFDWNTSSKNFSSTKLHQLRSALVDWDVNRNYNEPPVILNGGYLDLLETYPTICMNPRVYLYQKNNELDELLELDNIKYPTEPDNKLVLEAKEVEENEPEAEVTKESLIEDFKEILANQHSVQAQLDQEENERKLISEINDKENQFNAGTVNKASEIDIKIDQLTDLLSNLKKKEDFVKVQFEKDFHGHIEEEVGSDYSKPAHLEEDKEKLKDIIVEQRNRELMKARALKPKPFTVGNNIKNNFPTENKRPAINRANKPNYLTNRILVDRLERRNSGTTGLRNIRNTCYMNSSIQCIGHVPSVTDLFCNGTYAKHNIRNPAAIIHETASLIRELWSTSARSLNPQEFYNKVCSLQPVYKCGNHEDSMEFLLFLLNHISEDASYEVNLPSIMTPRQKAWFNQFEGKNSVIIDLFYHQIRIKQTCLECGKKTYKFEIENSFMLPVPSEDFHVDDLMKEYLADFVISDYRCSVCKKPVLNRKEICQEPTVMIVVLKRYKQIIGNNGTPSLKKVDSRARFTKTNFRFGKRTYKLNSIIMHSGDMNYGHYTAAALTPNGWYEFNDETVKPININEDYIKLKACAFFYSICDEQ